MPDSNSSALNRRIVLPSSRPPISSHQKNVKFAPLRAIIILQNFSYPLTFACKQEDSMFDSSALNNALVRWAEKKNLAGVSAAIMSRDGLVYSFNYGWRDAACTLPVNNDTMFGIASMSKSLTALCACILASEGRLDLDAPVCDFLPSFSVAGQPPEAVTVRHLAMHTSGIPPMEPLEWSIAMNSTGRPENEWLTEMKRTAPNSMATIDEVIDYVAHCGYTTLGAPGEIMSYSNEGYATSPMSSTRRRACRLSSSCRSASLRRWA